MLWGLFLTFFFLFVGKFAMDYTYSITIYIYIILFWFVSIFLALSYVHFLVFMLVVVDGYNSFFLAHYMRTLVYHSFALPLPNQFQLSCGTISFLLGLLIGYATWLLKRFGLVYIVYIFSGLVIVVPCYVFYFIFIFLLKACPCFFY